MPVASTSLARTNVGITETAGKAGVVRFRRGLGFFPGHTIEIPILPFSHHQFPVAIDLGVGSFSATVEVISGEARVVAYASMIEHHSGDPMYVPAKRPTTVRQVIPIAAHVNGPVEWALETWYSHVETETGIIFFPLLLIPNPDPPALTFYPAHEPGVPRIHTGPEHAFSYWTN